MERIIEINNYVENNNFIDGHNSCVIFFGSQSCGHCKHMVIPYETLASKYPSVGFAHVEINKVKTDNVDGVPAFVGYKNRIPVEQVIGADRAQLESMISRLL